MGTNSYVTKLKAQLDLAIIQREHWKQLAENRNSIVVTEVCPESRSVEEYIIDADSVRASWRLLREYREQIEALRAALLGIASVNPAERGIERAKSYASDGLKGAGSELYARWLDTFKEAEALRAENARLRQAMQRLVTTHCAAAIKGQAADAELEQYLAAGIAQLEGQRDKLAGELAAIKGQQPLAFYWQDIGYPEPRKHGPYFGWPSESALRNVDGRAIPVPLYTLPPTSHDQEGA